MYKTAAVPAEQSRESTGKTFLVLLSRYEQALFRLDMSQQFGRLSSCCGWSHEAADIHVPTHSSECVASASVKSAVACGAAPASPVAHNVRA